MEVNNNIKCDKSNVAQFERAMDNNNSILSQDLVILDEDQLNKEIQANGYVHEAEESYLYDSQLVQGLSFDHLTCFEPKISPGHPGAGLKVRPLGTGDFDRERFSAMKNSNGTYFVTVIEDMETDQIIGTATLVMERKFIRGCAKKGIIEDVVVSNEYRGKQLGKLIVVSLIELGKSLGCYKISLNCADPMIKFYCSLGFKQESGNANFLQLRT
eukprot:maker-scaffold922_size80897-snap-gene-0.20 protein:Tk09253 transcript:maker-scaffold922_size80897-snap-gene-0.20-mRNA-1 annotation:"conserved hypothetical protein"